MKLTAVAILATIVLALPNVVPAEGFVPESLQSFQGFSGLLNTPSAHVAGEGSIHLMYTDQRENIWRNDISNRQDNYLLTLGLFDFLELGGRLTDAPGRQHYRDLSASLKVTTAAFTRDLPYWPVLAFGVQDVGGGANRLKSEYAVVSGDYWRFRLSAGYGFGSERMKGGFGGVEFRAHDWVTLLGEYDTKDTSAGIRIVTPELWITPVRLTATLKSALNHNPGTIDVAAGVTMPLDFRKRKPVQTGSANSPVSIAPSLPKMRSEAAKGGSEQRLSGVTQPTPVPDTQTNDAKNDTNTVSSSSQDLMRVLGQQLEKAGFIEIRVGQRRTRELVVEYENTIYNHNELDALGIVAGITCEQIAGTFELIHFIIKRKGLRVAAVSASVSQLRLLLDSTSDNSQFRDDVKFSYDTSVTDDTYFYPVSDGFRFPNTSLILAPGLQTFVGTEVGVFDYLLSFRPEIVSNLWNGGVFQARWDIPVAWSDSYDDRGPFKGFRRDPRMDRAMLFQGINIFPGLMANLGGGMVLGNTYGTLNEATWNLFGGAHRLRAVHSWARDTDLHQDKEVYLGAYRYQYAPLDLSLELTGGRFWGQDRGFSVELKRFFRDTAVSTYYKNTTTAEGKHWQAAGIQFVFPLTPSKDLKIGPVQLRGADEWGYAQESTLAIGSQKSNNVVSQSLAINPQPTPALYRSYYNRDRLSLGYVVQNLERLTESWQAYKQRISH